MKLQEWKVTTTMYQVTKNKHRRKRIWRNKTTNQRSKLILFSTIKKNKLNLIKISKDF